MVVAPVDFVSSERMKKQILLLLAGACACLLSGCATILKDDSQPVAFTSDPVGATVKINGASVGQTPTTVMLKHSIKRQMVQIEKPGYHPEAFRLEKKVDALTFGNVIAGGVIGFGVDIATGNATNYAESVHVRLRPLDAAADQKAEIVQSASGIDLPRKDTPAPVATPEAPAAPAAPESHRGSVPQTNSGAKK
ncbi:MAG: hypothetical protein C0518_03060 [Opitutus sp.]|nr:hypothetical protein [Opitutus sp.]